MIRVRVVFPEGNSTEFDTEALPQRGDNIVIPNDRLPYQVSSLVHYLVAKGTAEMPLPVVYVTDKFERGRN